MTVRTQLAGIAVLAGSIGLLGACEADETFDNNEDIQLRLVPEFQLPLVVDTDGNGSPDATAQALFVTFASIELRREGGEMIAIHLPAQETNLLAGESLLATATVPEDKYDMIRLVISGARIQVNGEFRPVAFQNGRNTIDFSFDFCIDDDAIGASEDDITLRWNVAESLGMDLQANSMTINTGGLRVEAPLCD